MHKILHSNFFGYLSPNPGYGEHLETEYLRRLQELMPFKVSGVGGHRVGAFLGYETVVNSPIFYFTFVRDPVTRYLSHLNWQRNIMGIAWDVESFARESYFNNFQCYRISGKRNFEAARRIIEERFGFVGLLERWDESMLILQSLLSAISLDIRYSKSNEKRYGIDEINLAEQSDRIKDLVLVNNAEDIKLYEYVKNSVYPRYLSAVDEGAFERRLSDYRLANKNFDFHPIYMVKRKVSNMMLSGIVQPLMKWER